MKLVLLGAPGAGKGTQASALSEHLQIPHISTGDIFRANMRQNTALGIKAKEYISKGLLVPDELTIDLVLDRLTVEDCANGYLLDGFPRNLAQAEALSAKEELDAVVNIDVPDQAIIDRMGGRRVCPECGESYHVDYLAPKVEGICDKCGSKLIVRDDDKPETVKNRLKVYHDQTVPLIEYYDRQNLIVTVDGTQSPEEVTSSILRELEDR